MNRASRLERNAQFVEWAKQGKTIDEIAGIASVSYATVRNVLRAADVSPKREDRRTLPASGFKILARLLNGIRDSDVASEFRITRQRVHEVKMRARQAGIRV